MAAPNIAPPPVEPEPPGLSRIPRIIFWVTGAAIFAFPVVVWILGLFSPNEANYPAIFNLVLIVGLPCLVTGFIARPGETSRWLRAWLYAALVALIAAIVGLVVHIAVSGAAGEESAVSVIAFFIGIVCAPTFFITAVAAVITWLRRFEE